MELLFLCVKADYIVYIHERPGRAGAPHAVRDAFWMWARAFSKLELRNGLPICRLHESMKIKVSRKSHHVDIARMSSCHICYFPFLSKYSAYPGTECKHSSKDSD
jgi:hypothetical protein